MKVRALLITTLFSILLSVVVSAVYLLRHATQPMTDDSRSFSTENPTIPVAYTASAPIRVTPEAQATATESIFDWATSKNIKYATYTAPQQTLQEVKTDIAQEDITPATSLHPQEENPFSLWDWIVRAPEEASPQVPTQKDDLALYKTYGNTLGLRIQSFVIQAGDQNKTLSDFVIKRDEENRAMIRKLGTAYERLGEDIIMIESPEPFLSSQRKLGESYVAIGTALQDLTSAESDTDILRGIYSYNAKVDNFAQDYLRMATLFGAFEITFMSGEGGDIFSPPSR